jgi:large subunit ribosomal protein L10
VLKSKKKLIINELNNLYNDNNCIIVSQYQGLTVSQITSLRRSLKESGARIKIAKNSLSKIAASNSNVETIHSVLSGPVALTYANDPLQACKVLVDFAKKNKDLKIISGIIDSEVCSNDKIIEISKLPSLDQIRGKIIGAVSLVASNIVGVVNAPGQKVARVISAFSTK